MVVTRVVSLVPASQPPLPAPALLLDPYVLGGAQGSGTALSSTTVSVDHLHSLIWT